MSPQSVTVDFAVQADVAYAYLSDPRNRPAWQSSLRRVEDVAGDGGTGTTWYDVTAVGVRPRMTVTDARPGLTWAETGTWGRIEADLRLDFSPLAAGTRVDATFAVRTPRLLAPFGLLLRRLAALGIRGDLRRANRALGS